VPYDDQNATLNRCSKRHNNATIRDKVLIDIERG
jgi:hypothetical protein